jgi:hypothetical protein
MITGLLMLLLGLWIIKKSNGPAPVTGPPQQGVQLTQEMLKLRNTIDALEQEIMRNQQIQERCQSMINGLELDNQVLKSTLQREQRAKQTVRALCYRLGMDEKDTDQEIEKIDGEDN